MRDERKKEEVVRPIVSHVMDVPRSRLTFRAACFKGSEWSLKHFYNQADADENRPFAKKLATALHQVGAKRVYAPSPAEFNARIIPPYKLEHIIPLGNGINVWRNKAEPADGTSLSFAGDAGIFSAGGCGVIVASNGDDMLFGHAGRDCVVDRRRVETRGKEEDRHTDIVQNIIAAIGGRPDSVHLWPLFFITPKNFYHRFDDKNHAKYNRHAAEYLTHTYGPAAGSVDTGGMYINLPGIVSEQAKRCGVPAANIHTCYQYMPEGLPHTRDGDGKGRYLVAIVRQ